MMAGEVEATTALLGGSAYDIHRRAVMSRKIEISGREDVHRMPEVAGK